MTLEYFHEKQLFVFLDYFWKFVILEKTGGSVERQMARLNEKLLYILIVIQKNEIFFTKLKIIIKSIQMC